MNAGVLSSVRFQQISGVPKHSVARMREEKRKLESFVLDELRWAAIVRSVVADVLGSTVIYALTRDHGYFLTQHLRHLGESAEYVDGETPVRLRMGVLDRFRRGETRVLVNVALLIEGVDCPAARNVVLTYPVGSRIRLQQMIGRVLRGPAIGGSSDSAVWSIEGDQSWLERVLHSFDFRLAGWRVRELPSHGP